MWTPPEMAIKLFNLKTKQDKAKASGSPNRSDGPIAAAATPATAEQRRREANRKGREDSLLGGSTGSNNAGYGEIKRLLGQ